MESRLPILCSAKVIELESKQNGSYSENFIESMVERGSVTRDESKVTCKECLEIIHA